MPVYNGEKYVEQTILSLLALDYPDYEIIFSDNHSTDGTAAIIKHYAQKTGRIGYVLTKEFHYYGEYNFNNCLTLGDGEYVAVYHADDVYYRDILRRSAEALAGDASVGAVVARAERIDANGDKIGDGSFFYENSVSDYDFDAALSDALRIGCSPFICSSAMFRRETIKKHGLAWNCEKYKTSSDLGLFLNLLKHAKIKLIRENMLAYRITQTQGSTTVIRNRLGKGNYFLVLRDYRPQIAANKYRPNYYYSVAKDLLVRALNFTYAGEYARSDRRLKAFFRVFWGKFQFLRKFPSAWLMLCLGGGVWLLNRAIPFEAVRKKLVFWAFKLGRAG